MVIMGAVEEILQSKRKPKEKVSLLAKKVKENNKFLNQLIEYFEVGSVADKGNCIEVMEYVSQDDPKFVLPYIKFIIEHINNDAPKVKWETARVIGNVAQQFPDKVSNAIEKLFLNTKDKGTVVRWSAAFALTEIAKNNPKMQKELVPKFSEIVKKEENNGVKNVYVKALKILVKSSQ